MLVLVVVVVCVCVCVCVCVGGGVILGEVKARPKDIISFSLDYISKSKVQTSNPSSSPIPLDTPARPADYCSNFPEGFVAGDILRVSILGRTGGPVFSIS